MTDYSDIISPWVHFICNQLRVFRKAGGDKRRHGELDGAWSILLLIFQIVVSRRDGELPIFPVRDGVSESAGCLRYERGSGHDGERHEVLVRWMVSILGSHKGRERESSKTICCIFTIFSPCLIRKDLNCLSTFEEDKKSKTLETSFDCNIKLYKAN